MIKYNHSRIEKKWQKYWAAKKVFLASDFAKASSDKKDFAKSAGGRTKKYVLAEFPYPSGAGLHMGHLRPYVAADVFARFHRLSGKEVLFPIGWDAFGLPAENYAIKMGVHPSITTKKNIANAKKQMLSWGLSFDWSREINTTDPNYYKWTQWLFLQFYKAGLAYEATGLINWCPKDKTGLANEEVIDGHCERCGTLVEKKELRQWYLKITAYAEKLLEGLKQLPQWPEAVKLQQENWIGKSTGAKIKFSFSNFQFSVTVFTTRPDTIYGATYLVLAPEHSAIENCKLKIENYDEIQKYIESVKNRSDVERTTEGKDKTGVELKGVKAINPATKQEIPIFVADYVLGHYGTGAIMAVPAHDQRDFEFAKKFNLTVKKVVEPKFIATNPKDDAAVKPGQEFIKRNAVCAVVKNPKTGKYLCLSWKNFVMHGFVTGGVEDGEDFAKAALREIHEETGYRNVKLVSDPGLAIHSLFYHRVKQQNRWARFQYLFFELIDEQRDAVSPEESAIHEIVWKDKTELKDYLNVTEGQFILDFLDNHDSIYAGYGILANSGEFNGLDSEDAIIKISEKFGKLTTQYKLRDWVFSRQRYWGEPIPIIHCPKCGAVPVAEKDLPLKLPFVKNYEPTGTGESPLAAISKWVNVKCPKCKGPAKRETNTMPNWAGSSWYYLRYTDPKDKKSFADIKKQKYWTPVDVYFGGMEHTTLHLLYSRFWNLFLYDQKLVTSKEPYLMRKPHGIVLGPDGEKMSKSRGNVVNPDDGVKTFGADTVRMYELFLGPHEAMVSWNDQGIVGVYRFLDRVWNWGNQFQVIKSKVIKSQPKDSELAARAINKLIKKVTEDIENFRFNTSVSAFMEFYNTVKDEAVSKEAFKKFLIVLYPFAPHLTEELFQMLGGKKSLQLEKWPKWDESKLVESTADIIIQVNGKVKGKITVTAGSIEDEVKTVALKNEGVTKALAGNEIKRVIFVPNKLINLVV